LYVEVSGVSVGAIDKLIGKLYSVSFHSDIYTLFGSFFSVCT